MATDRLKTIYLLQEKEKAKYNINQNLLALESNYLSDYTLTFTQTIQPHSQKRSFDKLDFNKKHMLELLKTQLTILEHETANLYNDLMNTL